MSVAGELKCGASEATMVSSLSAVKWVRAGVPLVDSHGTLVDSHGTLCS